MVTTPSVIGLNQEAASMRILVTGANGHIGSAVVKELLEAGHQVVGLARSDSSAAAVEAMGAEVRRGDLDDLDGLRLAAADSEGVIHTAFKHEQMRAGGMAAAATADLAATRAIGEALEGSGKPFVTSSGTLTIAGLSPGRFGTEEDAVPDGSGPRVDAENLVIALGGRGVRSSVVRNPPIVHSDLDHHGFTHILIAIAREKGVSVYVGDGSNRWPSAHTLDVAHLYRLAVESAPAGTRLHAAAESSIPFRDIAEVIGRMLGLPTASIAPEGAATHFAALGPIVAWDNPTSSERTQRLLGWEPTHPGLIQDLEQGHYFDFVEV
jgi:nucleoside-diphosphate-sugar epimerase